MDCDDGYYGGGDGDEMVAAGISVVVGSGGGGIEYDGCCYYYCSLVLEILGVDVLRNRFHSSLLIHSMLSEESAIINNEITIYVKSRVIQMTSDIEWRKNVSRAFFVLSNRASFYFFPPCSKIVIVGIIFKRERF